ncbi:RidA family protein [Oceanicoccus sagamiensis]|uniref:Reactive intermediate/imine deaminase n=1 Tax=Oceanicoccus sagamiensis TaxID=716816 RepID=A0A1X9NAI0_9GAMM|nr:RidA family protein [Oceanicoccus sagamiensis]ARN74161.1 reactive intermediate/imine deaminase [Oceanicoccus sagamiensis]
MSQKEIIATNKAPQAIGPYSQAVKVGDTVYLSGQIPLIPETMELIAGDIKAQAQQVFNNLTEVAAAAGGSLDDAVKVNISLTDLGDFAEVNEVMAGVFKQPFPARACVQVAALPKGASIEVEVILSL